MTEATTPEWCRNLGALSDRELGVLTECAVAVIAEAAGDNPDVRELRELPPSALAPDLADALSRSGVTVGEREIDQLCEDSHASRVLAIALLQQACTIPALRAEIDAAYVARQRMMVADPVTIVSIALVVLVMKLRRVKLGRDGVDVTLDPVRNVVAKIVKDLLGS
jgi:hypothetical protein